MGKLKGENQKMDKTIDQSRTPLYSGHCEREIPPKRKPFFNLNARK